MSEWKLYKLGSLVDIGSSKRIFYNEYVKKGVPFYRSKEIIEKYKGNKVSTELFITKEKFDELKEKFGAPVKNDILLTSVGTLGIPYVVNEDDKFYFKDGNLTWFKNYTSNISSLYLYYWIISPVGRNELEMSSIGSTQAALTIKGLKALDILLPSLKEQKATAKVLSSLDDKIDLLHRQNKTLEELAQTLFRQWFVEEADEEWEEVLITDLFEVRDGTHDSPKQKEVGKPLITTKHMSNNKLDIENAYLISEEDFEKVNKRSVVEQHDILFSMIGTIGLVFLEESEKIDYAIKNIGLFKTSQNKDYKYYLYLWLKSSCGVEFIHKNRSGSTQEYISLTSLRNIIFYIPNKQVILNFNKKVNPLFKKIFRNQQQIKTLKNLRDTLLPKLMSGEIRVRA